MKNIMRVTFKILLAPISIALIIIGFTMVLVMTLISWFERWLDRDIELGDRGESIFTFGMSGLLPRSRKTRFLVEMGVISWTHASRRPLTRKEIYENQDELKWSEISIYQKLKERDIIAFQDKVSWHSIAQYQDLSEEFIYEHKDRLPTANLRKNKYYMDIEETNPELALFLRLT